jgi:hypothetical protein
MARVSKLVKLKKELTEEFNSSNKQIFSIKQIREFLDELGLKYRLPRSMHNSTILDFFQKEGVIREMNFKFKSYNYSRYILRNPSLYAILSSLSKTIYISHYSAMYIHNLTEQIPKKIYCNDEQREKKKLESNKYLEQESINNAFKRKMRRTNNICEIDDNEIFLLNGKYTDNIGIINLKYNNEEIRVSSIERTLIDIVVRPDYSGGPSEIIKAYMNARGKFSINRLNDYLNKMDYIYPYHQSICFYLERAGNYSDSAINIIGNKELKNDFYLTYGENIENLDYNKKWRLFFPKGL